MESLISNSGLLTMSSREIAELTGKRHDNVMRVCRELKASGVSPQIEETPYVEAKTGQQYKEFRLGKRDSLVLVARLSPEFTARIVDRWIELEATVTTPRQLTTTETLIQMLQIQAEVEKRQEEQARAISDLRQQVDRVETAQVVLRARPANAEAMTHIRARIGRVYGLSTSVIDEVMRQSPYAPKPAGMVRNDHVDADGALYAVYWQKDVTATFNRFTDECKSVTQFMFTHPFIDGRFRVARKSVVA